MREKTMKWSPFFSHLLQSRAALLQAPDPQSKLKTMPLLETDFFIAPYQASPHTTAAQNKEEQTPTPTPHPLPLAVSSPAQAEVSAPSPQTQNKPDEPGAPAQSSMANSQTECQPQGPSVTATSQTPAAQDGASPTSSAPNSSNPSVQPTKRFTLPLIRSKTGRIILPSSLKPSKLRPPAPRVSSFMCIIIFSQIYFLLFLTVGQGFYTLMVMNTKQKGEDGDTQPSDVDSLLKSANPSESGRVLEEEDKTVRFSNPKLKRLAVKAPLAKLATLNKSIIGPPVAPKAAENSQEGGSVSCLSFNHGRQIPTAVEPDPSPGSVRRGRGRPRKNPITPVTPVPPVSENEKPTVVEDSSKTRLSESKTSILVEERQSKKIIVVVAKDTPAVVNDSPVPVKRGRGRPPKKKQEIWSPPATGAGSSPSKSNEDSPMWLSRSFKSPDASPKRSPATASLQVHMKTSRPLTRGALGKDFPSAKKRSWIDVEKELDPELEYE